MKTRPPRAFALLPTLALMFIIAALITVALRENISERAHLKTQKEGLDGLYLAESGAQEALHRLAADWQAGSLAHDVGDGSVSAEWAPADGGFRIVSVGIGRRTAPEASRRTVTMMAKFTAEGAPAEGVPGENAENGIWQTETVY